MFYISFNCFLDYYQIEGFIDCKQKIMEDYPNKRISIETKLKVPASRLSHHTSLQYGATFFSKKPIFRQSSSITKIENASKQQIFELVYKFIGKLITNSEYMGEIFDDMKYATSDKNISVAKITFHESEEHISVNSIGSNEIQREPLKDTSDFENIIPQINIIEPKEGKKKQGRQQKVSIMMGSFSDFGSGSHLSGVSCNSFSHISSINFPPHALTLDMICRIFEQPEPFLINLAMCLKLKFLFYSKMPLTGANSCWILSISTIIAYKIYYDEPVEGLIESFSQILQIGISQVKELQRFFLGQIAFQAAITNQQYHIMLSKILSQE